MGLSAELASVAVRPYPAGPIRAGRGPRRSARPPDRMAVARGGDARASARGARWRFLSFPSTTIGMRPPLWHRSGLRSPPSRVAARKRYLAALAIPALLAIGIAPALWERAARTQNSGAEPTVTQEATNAARAPENTCGARRRPRQYQFLLPLPSRHVRRRRRLNRRAPHLQPLSRLQWQAKAFVRQCHPRRVR